MKPSLTAVVITKNEEKMIVNCLSCLQWCDTVLVVDNNSDDRTMSLARQQGATVVDCTATTFDAIRNEAMGQVKTDWVVFIDADERVTPALAQEILVQVETTAANALILHRENIMYGHHFHAGGWDEWLPRVFRVKAFTEWTGAVHETPVFAGEAVRLHTSLLHLTHRSTAENLEKTAAWTPIEAQLLFAANVPPVTIWTLLRKGTMEFLRRAFIWKGYKDGQAGLIEAVVQGLNRILVYVQVWELQQKSSLPDAYAAHEKTVAAQWQKAGKNLGKTA